MKKNAILTTEQLKKFKRRVLKEAFAVNTELVKTIHDYIDKNYSFTKYDDINEDGDVIQKIAIQVLSANREPLQTISPEKMLDKMDVKFKGKIKDDKERREFIRQILKDWVDGKITKDGLLSVNSTGKNNLSLNEYANGSGKVNNYFLPWFMWSNIQHGTTQIERAAWFVQFDGVYDANYSNDGFLILSAQKEGIINVLDYLGYMEVGSDEYEYNELCEYLGCEPESYEEIAELLKKKHGLTNTINESVANNIYLSLEIEYNYYVRGTKIDDFIVFSIVCKDKTNNFSDTIAAYSCKTPEDFAKNKYYAYVYISNFSDSTEEIMLKLGGGRQKDFAYEDEPEKVFKRSICNIKPFIMEHLAEAIEKFSKQSYYPKWQKERVFAKLKSFGAI